MDFVSAVPDPRLGPDTRALVARAVDAHNAVLAERHSFDPFYGRRLMGELEDAGLAHVACEGRASMWRGGQPGGAAWRLTLEQLREPMIASGLVSAADLDALVPLCDDPQFSII